MDACCLCRPFDDRTQDRIRIESEAVMTILGRCNEDWILVGSDTAHISFEVVDKCLPRLMLEAQRR
jgi:hypothetical protein